MKYDSKISSILKLTFSGFRYYDNWIYKYQWTNSTYWSSSPSDIVTYIFSFDSKNNTINPYYFNNRAYWYNIRCIKNKIDKIEVKKDDIKIQNNATECKKWITEITFKNGQTWSCMNLWATEVWDWKTQPKDCNWSIENCNKDLKWLWDYYQWWKNDAWFSKNWYPINNSWWWNWTSVGTWTYKDQSIENQKLMQWPCPIWWHVPTIYEWWLACNSILWKICEEITYENYNSLISSKLKLPFAGNHNHGNSYYYSQSTSAGYWSSTPYSADLYYLYFFTNSIFPANGNNIAHGFSVRCLKN
jgi:hypothetical protein